MDTSTVKEILLGSDDQTFCDLLLTLLETTTHDKAHALTLLYESWVLERLQQIKQQNPPIFFGSFLGPLRQLFPRQVFPGDLFQAMQHTAWESEGMGGMVTEDDFLQAALAFWKVGGKPGVSPGWVTVGRHYSIRPGELTVVTGIANHMKSTVVQNLCVNIANEQKWHIGIFSPEHAPLGELSRCLGECFAGRPMRDMPLEQFKTAATWVAQQFHPIVAADEVAPTLPWILGVARQQVRQWGIQGLVIDPWNEIDHIMAYRQTETQYISQALSKVRRFARHHQVHVWLVVHPTKMQKAQTGEYEGKHPPPTPYDINGSAHWYNKADNCLCVWRDVDADSNKVQLHIQKVRYRAVGRPGVVELVYNDRRRFEDV